jgi:hypothetical protein
MSLCFRAGELDCAAAFGWSGLAAVLVDAEDVAAGIAKVSDDLAGVRVDGQDDLAAVGGDEVDGGGGAVDHDGDDDARIGEWAAVENPHAADLDAVVEGYGPVAVLAQLPAEDGGVKGGGDSRIGGGDFEVADFSVSDTVRHGGSFWGSLEQFFHYCEVEDSVECRFLEIKRP